MHDWLVVARWELLRQLRRKDFLISTLLIPVFVAGGITVTSLIKRQQSGHVTRIAVAREDGSAATLPPLRGFTFVDGSGPRKTLIARINDRKIDGAVLLPADLGATDTVDVLVRWPRQAWVPRLAGLIGKQARIERAEAAGLDTTDLARLERPVRLAERVTQGEREGGRLDRVVAIGTIVLLIMSLFTAISYMGIGISGEKQARVTEVIVSAIPPQAWIDGKIAAYTVIGLLQAVVWGLTAVGALVFFTATVPTAVNPASLAVTLLFALTGFAFFIAMLATVMATIKDLQSTTKFQAYLLFIPFLPLAVLAPVVRNPDAPWVMALSQLPIFSPTLVPARFAIGGIQPWEVALAWVLLVAGFWLMRRAAGAAFRIGMLMYGKELSLPELWRWSREG